MPGFDPTLDAAFTEYADLELRRHHLLQNSQEGSTEISDLEDRMNELWDKLDEVQQRSLKGIGSDLNWIRRSGAAPPKGRKSPQDVAETELRALTKAMRARDWHATLHYLRLCSPCFQAVSLARERSVAYEAIGLMDLARVFCKYAANAANAEIGGEWMTHRIPNAVFSGLALEQASVHAMVSWEGQGVRPTASAVVAEDQRLRGIEYRAAA